MACFCSCLLVLSLILPVPCLRWSRLCFTTVFAICLPILAGFGTRMAYFVDCLLVCLFAWSEMFVSISPDCFFSLSLACFEASRWIVVSPFLACLGQFKPRFCSGLFS